MRSVFSRISGRGRQKSSDQGETREKDGIERPIRMACEWHARRTLTHTHPHEDIREAGLQAERQERRDDKRIEEEVKDGAELQMKDEKEKERMGCRPSFEGMTRWQ